VLLRQCKGDSNVEDDRNTLTPCQLDGLLIKYPQFWDVLNAFVCSTP